MESVDSVPAIHFLFFDNDYSLKAPELEATYEAVTASVLYLAGIYHRIPQIRDVQPLPLVPAKGTINGLLFTAVDAVS